MTKSQRIAVAGGTGGIGRYIVEGLLTVKPKYSLYIIVLSRSSGDLIVYQGASASVIQVDYDNSSQLESVLREHAIDTIICTLANQDLTQFSAIQERLLHAALNVPTFRRFAPSEFAIDSEGLKSYNYQACKLDVLKTLRKVKEDYPSREFEWTKFIPGIFINYFAFGSKKEEEAMKHLRRHPVWVDVANGKADIAGDGGQKLYYTRAEDTGLFVAEATQLDTWPETLDMAGDVISLNEVVAIAERVTGRKFEVKYNTKEDLLADMPPTPQGWTDFLRLCKLSIIMGEVGQGTKLNELTAVKPMNVEQCIEKWWGSDA
ncbi:hypothetical protein Moror_8882 [Moniliophthora roreri MCA 2997]|uniref:NmrA-like domain-containing protein n=2 Tax=Moniliophthora roreri TaxID=221103 RepID=V2XKN8_MONRO|nr:hypothetical protein Moror_8882 [Moniliophthora roreri MCA 2997]KAI3604727.1 hypothetical protein WG66_008457 [Moniliophthora roreri]